MRITDRTTAASRAKNALHQLEAHPATSREQLGTARDQLNTVRNHSDETAVDDAISTLESILAALHGPPTGARLSVPQPTVETPIERNP